jgi:hypothetical protein
MTTELGEVIGTSIANTNILARQIGDVGDVVYRLDFYPESVALDDSYFKLVKRDIGSSFVFGHQTWGKIGSNLSPQPYIGDSRGPSITIVEQSGTTAP